MGSGCGAWSGGWGPTMGRGQGRGLAVPALEHLGLDFTQGLEGPTPCDPGLSAAPHHSLAPSHTSSCVQGHGLLTKGPRGQGAVPQQPWTLTFSCWHLAAGQTHPPSLGQRQNKGPCSHPSCSRETALLSLCRPTTCPCLTLRSHSPELLPLLPSLPPALTGDRPKVQGRGSGGRLRPRSCSGTLSLNRPLCNI